MNHVSMSDGATVHAVITQPRDPEQTFRFAEPLPPYPRKKPVHISATAIRHSRISLADLTPGVIVKLAVRSSVDRLGNPSWTAASVQLAPDFEPAEPEPTHLGVVDSGGVQHLRGGDTWFLEHIVPELERDKVVVHQCSLARAAKSRLDRLVPGALMMFSWDGRNISAANLYDAARLKTDVLTKGLNGLRSMSSEQVASGVTEVIRRDEHALLEPIWPQLSLGALGRIIQSLAASGDLSKLGPEYPEPLVNAAFGQLSATEALALFPDHPVAWKHLQPAAALCSEEIGNGASLDQVAHLCAERGAPAKVWQLLATSH